MKKQFFRVKQLADQTFSRVDKTEVLSDDLQEADRRVEGIKLACQNTSKKLAGCISSHGQERDKRIRKVPKHILGAAMQECLPGIPDDNFLLGDVLHVCGKTLQDLASDEVDLEVDVEQKVLAVLQSILEKDIPNIMKYKRNLTKLTLDMDSAKTRYQTAVKHSANTGASRVESIKSEWEDAEAKFEQCRDQLACEMFQLVSRESELAQTIVQYAKFQHEFHKAALERLQLVIPTLEKCIDECPHKPVYGVPLEEHLIATGRKIALPIELSVWALHELGMEEEGLFRVTGGASKLRRIKLSMDAQCLTPQAILEYRDSHVVAGALKSYLRELPEPLMTFALYEDWMSAARIQTSNEARLQALWQVVQKLPAANFNNLRHLIRFLHVLSQNHEVNKMTPQNIAIVIAPNLIWSKNSDPRTMGMNMNAANTYSLIVDSLVSYADWFFPGEIDFCENYARENTALVNGMSRSVGPVMSTEIMASSPPSMAYTSHKRSSSGEGQLINLGDSSMKRTQSSSSLSDHSSPPQGSPKPATRRKNKPAPVPPASCSVPVSEEQLESRPHEKPEKPPRPSVAPAITTLPRPSKKPIDPDNKTLGETIKASMNPTTGIEPFASNGIAVRRSLDLDQNSVFSPSQKSNVSSSTNVSVDSHVSKSTEELFCTKNDDPAQFITSKTENFMVANEGKGTVNDSPPQKNNVPGMNKVSSALDSVQQKSPPNVSGFGSMERRPQQRPVAAPRSINISCGPPNVPMKDASEQRSMKVPPGHSKASGESIQKDTESFGIPAEAGNDIFVGVQLRRTSATSEGGENNRLSKPVVPERPAVLLRPHASSFRASRLSSDSDNTASNKSNSESECPILERTQVYSVDKQQVSIIQVGGEKEKIDSALSTNPSIGGCCKQSILPLAEKTFPNGKPERPTKPKTLGQNLEYQSLCWHPEEILLEFDANKSGMKNSSGNVQQSVSPRVSHKLPRSVPPLPPAPVKNSRTESLIESTDL